MNKFKSLNIIILILGIIPLIWLTLVLITYFGVAMEIGYLPTYNNPDSGHFELFLSNYSFWNYGLLLMSQIGIITVPVLLLSYRIITNYSKSLPKLTKRNIIYGYGGYLIFICFFIIKPLNEIVYWYLD